MQHCEASRRTVHAMNLDPAAEYLAYTPSIDIRDLITLEEVMDDLRYGPNGGLVYCLEYLLDNFEWMENELDDYQDDYLIIDCPGQIELYTHFPVMKDFVGHLQRLGYQVVVVYLMDAQFTDDAAKFISGSLAALSAMIQLELPHINVLSKIDIYLQRHTTPDGTQPRRLGRRLDRFLNFDINRLLTDKNRRGDMDRPIARSNVQQGNFASLNSAVARLLEEYNMVSFLPLDITDEDSIELVLSHADHAIQYGEDLEPREPKVRLCPAPRPRGQVSSRIGPPSRRPRPSLTLPSGRPTRSDRPSPAPTDPGTRRRRLECANLAVGTPQYKRKPTTDPEPRMRRAHMFACLLALLFFFLHALIPLLGAGPGPGKGPAPGHCGVLRGKKRPDT
ncbi:hypothetical protein, variant [Fonticula alba]|nr:hypothetical protein, variant [Fonticula alba]KCV68494.1 hypothetical protein, variant [Fonticula alba]|eukprot:XP_009496926.1 hypothetical protein, variant [Fonticula alba]